ncbi:MAG TPA: hypothetical protein VIK18_17270 [Pirellulales bacterium]
MRRLLHGTLLQFPQTLVLIVTVVCWLPYFAGSVIPFHDSAYVYQNFHCFYSEFVFNHDLVRWFPYANYGIPADFGQNANFPTAYVAMAVGLLTGLRDTLLLHKVAMLLNEVLFACGLFRLAGELYSQRFTRLLITLSAVLSTSWLQQSMLNLSVMYLLPLVMFYLVRFFRTGRIAWLYWAGLIEVCSIIGSVAYFAPLQAIVLGIFAAGLCCEYWPVLWQLRQTGASGGSHSPAVRPTSPDARLRQYMLRGLIIVRGMFHPLLFVMLAVATIIVCFLGGAFSGLVVLTPGRDSVTGNIGLETFLNYGRPPIATTLVGFLAGVIPHGDNSYYIGLLPLLMFSYALCTERSKIFLGTAAAALLLVWLSFGGKLATCIYYLPGMHMFRHVGLVFGIGGLLLLVAGGFGLDRLVRHCRRLAVPLRPKLGQRLPLLLIVGGLMLADLWHCCRSDDLDVFFVHGDAWPFAAFRGLLYLVAGLLILFVCLTRYKAQLAPALPAIAAVVCLLDMGSFRAEVFATVQHVSTLSPTLDVFAANPLPFRSERSTGPVGDLARARLEVFTRRLRFVNDGHNSSLCSLIALDACRPPFRGDFLCLDTCKLLRTRGGVPTAHPTDAYLPAKDPALFRALGCGVPKLRLTRQIKVARTEQEAVAWLSTSADLYATTLLLTDDNAVHDTATHLPEPPCGLIEVESFSSNRLAMQVRVDGQQPAWLVYADSWHPGWTAWIDGVRTALPRANLGLKAVHVPPGRHHVEFVYAPALRNTLAWCFALIGLATGAALLIDTLVSTLAEIRGQRPDPPVLPVLPASSVGYPARDRQPCQSTS